MVLSSCRSTTVPDARRRDDRVVVRSLAQTFLQHNAAAVVSMQGDVASTAAATFSGELYSALVAGHPVDIAVARSRSALDTDLTEWVLPSLTVAAAPDDVLRTAAPAHLPPWYPDRGALGAVTHMVNHGEARRRLWDLLEPDDTSSRLVVLRGVEAGVGAGGVLRATLLTAHLRGRAVVLAALGERRLPFEEMLCTVRDAADAQLGPAAAEPRRRFDHALAYLARGTPPPPLADGPARSEPWRPRPRSSSCARSLLHPRRRGGQPGGAAGRGDGERLVRPPDRRPDDADRGVSRLPGESVSLLPASLTEPLWVELAALIGSDERPEFAPSHTWGCPRRRIPNGWCSTT